MKLTPEQLQLLFSAMDTHIETLSGIIGNGTFEEWFQEQCRVEIEDCNALIDTLANAKSIEVSQ